MRPIAADARIVRDPATGPEIGRLIAYHLDQMHEHSPADAVHALGLAALQASDVTLWTLWEDGALLGCAALRRLDKAEGEIKSMRTDPAHLRRGVAAALLTHVIAEAKVSGLTRLSLETGSAPAFQPAIRLYERFGFTPCDAFGDYRPNAFSRFMTMAL